MCGIEQIALMGKWYKDSAVIVGNNHPTLDDPAGQVNE